MSLSKRDVMIILVTMNLASCVGSNESASPVPVCQGITVKLVCLAKFQQIEPNSCLITVSIQNLSSTEYDLGPIRWLENQLCQVYMQEDGNTVGPKYAVEDGWPWNRLTTRGEYWDRVNNVRGAIVIPAFGSYDILTTKIPLNPKADEHVIWAQIFLPHEGSKFLHKLGARGPVIRSNTLLIRSEGHEIWGHHTD